MLRKLVPIENELACGDGSYVALRIMPYRTLNNVIDGVVITFLKSVDHTVRPDGGRLQRICERLQDLVPASVLLLDGDLKVVDANRRFSQVVGVDKAGIPGKALTELAGNTWDRNALLQIENALKGKKNLVNQDVKSTMDGGESKSFTINAYPIDGKEGEPPLFLVTAIEAASGDGVS